MNDEIHLADPPGPRESICTDCNLVHWSATGCRNPFCPPSA
jgi:hypothetical protein